jgi:exonuclease III
MKAKHPVTRALFWNIWGHRRGDDIHAFIAANQAVDVICLTEVTSMHRYYDGDIKVHTSKDLKEPPSRIDGLQQLVQAFSHQYHIEYETPDLATWKCLITGNQFEQVGFGSALLVKRDLDVLASGHFRIEFADDATKTRIMQYVVYQIGGDVQLVAHLHGVWFRENTKGDDPRRNYQSKIVRKHLLELIDQYGVDKLVFGGDLNLHITTEALALLEHGDGEGVKFRLTNLCKKFGKSNTRTRDYREFDNPEMPKSADYVLVWGNIKVTEEDTFVGNEVRGSDHAPILVGWS